MIAHLNGLLTRLQHRITRDMAWLLFSPPLLDESAGVQLFSLPPDAPGRLADWLLALDANPAPLQHHLANAPRRLGLYAEQLWLFIWQQAPVFEQPLAAVHHNLPVYAAAESGKGRITRGAFDFLLGDGESWQPLEVTVKFYLGVPEWQKTPGDWFAWPGPDSRDSAGSKFGHLVAHQLRLAETPEGRERLQQLEPSLPVKPGRALLRGYFFYPANRVLNPPRHSHPQHLRGQWWYGKDFLQLAADRRFVYLPKEEWLSPQRRQPQETASGQQLWEQLSAEGKTRYPLMLAELRPAEGGYVEQQRHCIVPDYWPATATPPCNK